MPEQKLIDDEAQPADGANTAGVEQPRVKKKAHTGETLRRALIDLLKRRREGSR